MGVPGSEEMQGRSKAQYYREHSLLSSSTWSLSLYTGGETEFAVVG